ncbi:hypothetical protein [Methylobacterium sp.]|uniref:hypothetical protein n=1 Tax=Methylobacterium sp. TaxID=409 RepID=UPI003B015F02
MTKSERATTLLELAMAAHRHGKDGLLTSEDVQAIIALLNDLLTGNREERDAA